jgi:endonuclease III
MSCVSATGYDLGCLRRQRSCLYVHLQSRRLLQVIWKLFELCPTPEAAVAADTKDISAIIDTLGFYKRAAAFQRFSDDYVQKQVC